MPRNDHQVSLNYFPTWELLSEVERMILKLYFIYSQSKIVSLILSTCILYIFVSAQYMLGIVIALGSLNSMKQSP